MARDKSIDSIMGIDNFSSDKFKEIVQNVLFEGDNNSEEKVEALLNMNWDLFLRWYRFINRDCEDDIIYHTFHGTKGLEYDNVIMIFGDSLGRGRPYFSKYFAGYDSDLPEHELEMYRKGRNLLYVAVTRARKNLRILYTGEYQSKKEIFEEIFGNVSIWGKQTAN